MLKIDDVEAYPDGWTCAGPCGRKFFTVLPFSTDGGTECERCVTNEVVETLELANLSVEAGVLEEGAGLEEADPLEGEPAICPSCGEDARIQDYETDHCPGGLHVPEITRCGWCAECDQHQGTADETTDKCDVCRNQLTPYSDSRVGPCRQPKAAAGGVS